MDILKAKKLGATHIDEYGDYWKVDGDAAYFQIGDSEKWYRYAFTDAQDYIKKGDIKPL